MSDKESRLHAIQIQLEDWKEEIGKLKKKALKTNLEYQVELGNRILLLEAKIEEARAKLFEPGIENDDIWESIRNGIKSAWESLK